MHKFRDITPQRRANRAKCEKYQSYRKTLREDFHFRCGYCNDIDKVKSRSYTIDHFVPRNPKDPDSFSNHIEENEYYNLVYSCSHCNGSKGNTWPTRDGKMHHDGTKGFIDPTNEEYTNLFKRNKGGNIICNNINPELSKYISDNLKLWLPIHSIHWKIEKVMHIQELILEKLKEKHDPNLEELHKGILQKLGQLSLEKYNENE